MRACLFGNKLLKNVFAKLSNFYYPKKSFVHILLMDWFKQLPYTNLNFVV